jgi:predicted transcriptional regulator of viral defense system
MGRSAALRDQGEILELSRGLYQQADAGISHVDFVAVCGRAPHGMICLNSALAYWDLSDEIPAEVHLAVPSGLHRPAVDYPPTRVHVFHAGTFAIGRLEVAEQAGERVWVSDRERTVADAFRLRHLSGEDLAFAALRRYLQSRPRQAGSPRWPACCARGEHCRRPCGYFSHDPAEPSKRLRTRLPGPAGPRPA